MASPPPSSSSKFRAEPFVNMTSSTLDSARSSVSSNSTGGAQVRPLIGAAVSLVPEAHRRPHRRASTTALDENNHGLDDAPSPFTTGRLSTSSASGTSHAFSVFHAHTPSFNGRGSIGTVSDVQRSSITSTVSSSSRRSSYEGGGGLEKIHTGQGKSKRKPISVQQWGMMNTFKIRPPTALEASGSAPLLPPTPPSIAPHQQYIPYVPDKSSIGPLDPIQPTDERERPTHFVSEHSFTHQQTLSSPTIPRRTSAASLNLPPSSTQVPKHTRKRARKDAPLDPISPAFHHEEESVSIPTDMEGVQAIQSPQTAPILPTLPPPTMQVPLAPDQSVETITTTPLVVTLPPPPSTTPSAVPPPSLPTQAAPSLSYDAVQSTFSYQPTKYEPNERIFTLPDIDPLDRGGPSPKKWSIVHHKSRTLGGGEIALKRWVSQGELATPAGRPVHFKPVPLVHLLPTPESGSIAVSPSAGTSTPALLAVPFGAGGSSMAAGPSSLTPVSTTIPTSPGVKRLKTVKSEADLRGSEASGTATPKRKAPGTGVKRTKKLATTIKASSAPKGAVEPPIVSVNRAQSDDGDAEMLDA